MTKFTFHYFKDGEIYRPKIPIDFSTESGSITLMGLLDSGSDVFLIPKNIAISLGLELGKKESEIDGIGGKVKTIKSKVTITVGDCKIRMMEVNIQISDSIFDEILIGRIPFFKHFLIEIDENKKRVILTRTKHE